MAHDIFISHSTRDKAISDAVCAALEKAGIRCWIAPRDVQPGRSFAGEITRAIQQSQAMVLIFSAHSNSSEQVLREVQLAVESHLHLIQFRIEDVHLNDDLKYFLSTPHWLDALTPPLETHIKRLESAIKTLLAAPVEQESTAQVVETAKGNHAVRQPPELTLAVPQHARAISGLGPTHARKTTRRFAVAVIVICLGGIAGWWLAIYQPTRGAHRLESTQNKPDAAQTERAIRASTQTSESQTPEKPAAPSPKDPGERSRNERADTAAHGNKGKELAAAGKVDEAIAEYTKAIAISPQDERLYRDRGLVYRANNRFPEAIADFAKAIEIAPKSELGYIERGQVLMIQNQFDAALVDYNKAVELNPNNPVCYDRRGFAFYNLRKYDDAVKDYSTSIEKKADNPVTFSRRADAYVALNQFSKALPDLEAALKLKPEDPDLMQNLQFVQAKLRNR